MAFDDGVKTVSGSVAHTDDAATKVPFVSVKCGIDPTLTGVSSVTETQTGRNLCQNNLTTETVSGVTITVNADGTITLDGTATARITRNLCTNFEMKAGTYTLSCGTSELPSSCYFNINITGGGGGSCSRNTPSLLITLPETRTATYIRIDLANGSSFDNLVIYPMLEYGSTAHDYEPYTTPTTYTASLGRTIYGGTADIVNGTGKETHKGYTLDNLTWSGGIVGGADWCWYVDLSADNLKLPSNSEIFSGICDNYTPIRYNGIATNQNTIALRSNGYLYVNNGSDTTEPTGKVTIELAEPTDFTFTPITPTPETVGKVNNVYCNTGDTEVTYYDNAHGFAEVTVTRCGKNLMGVPTLTASSDSLCLDFGKNKTVSALTLSFLATSSEVSNTTSAIVDYREENGTHHYKTLNDFRDSNNVQFKAGQANNGVFKNTITNLTFRYVYISYTTNSRSKFTSDSLSNWQLELGSQASSYEPYEAVSKTAYLHKVIYGGQADVVKGTCKPKNLLKNLGTFPYTISATDQYYSEFSNYIQARQIPLFALENNVTYTLSFDVQCSNEPFNISVGVGDGRYLRDLGNALNLTSGRVSITFTPTGLTEGNNYFAFRAPRYGSKKDYDATVDNVQLEKASSASDFAPYFEPFSFPPISIGTDEGENTLFANEGDSSLTYRKAVD